MWQQIESCSLNTISKNHKADLAVYRMEPVIWFELWVELIIWGKGKGFSLVGWLGLIIFAAVVITSIAAWINTKIILEEIDIIKKHLGIPEKKAINIQILKDNDNNECDKKQDQDTFY